MRMSHHSCAGQRTPLLLYQMFYPYPASLALGTRRPYVVTQGPKKFGRFIRLGGNAGDNLPMSA